MQSVKLGVVCVSLEGEKTDLARGFKRQAVKSLQKENVEVVNAQKDITLSRQEAITQWPRGTGRGSGRHCISDWHVDTVRPCDRRGREYLSAGGSLGDPRADILFLCRSQCCAWHNG